MGHKWRYGVTYEKGTIQKDRHFKTLAEARRFYAKQVKYKNSPILFKFKPESYLRRLWRADVYWVGYRVRATLLIGAVLTVAAIWRLLWS